MVTADEHGLIYTPLPALEDLHSEYHFLRSEPLAGGGSPTALTAVSGWEGKAHLKLDVQLAIPSKVRARPSSSLPFNNPSCLTRALPADDGQREQPQQLHAVAARRRRHHQPRVRDPPANRPRSAGEMRGQDRQQFRRDELKPGQAHRS